MRSLTVGVWFAGLLGDGKNWIWFAIAAATLIFAFEAVSIGVLICRMVQAKKRNGEKGDHLHSFGVPVIAGAVAGTVSADSVLKVLMILCIAGAAVLTVLLIAARIAGFDFVSSVLHREEEERARQEAEERARREREDAERAEADRLAAAEHDERIRAEAEENARMLAAEEARRREAERLLEEQRREAAMAQEPETDIAEEETPADEPHAEPKAPAGGMTAVGGAPASAAEQNGTSEPGHHGRFVHMEKTVTETVRETQTTAPAAPAPAPAPAAAPASGGLSESEKLLKTLVEALIGQKQSEAAAKAKAEDLPDGSVPVSASPVDAPADDEDETAEEAAKNDREDEEDFVDDADDSDRFSGNERIIGYNEETGCYIVAHYRKSFEGRLIQSRPHIKHFYSELKNALLSYKGTKSRVSWNADTFTNGRTPIAKINIRSNNLELYLALDPASLEDTIYHGRDVSHQKRYADTPFKYKIRSDRKFGWGLELVQRVCEEQGLSPIDIEKIDYEEAYPFEETEDLVRRGVIREYIREEKPATSFELAEDHVSQTPDVDETVVPPSANVFWELDNDAPKPEPEEKAPEENLPAEEPAKEVPEVQPEPEPAPEPAAPQVTQTVTKETVRTTQIRYTEQVFGDGMTAPATPPVTYAEFVADEPMNEPADEPAEAPEEPEADDMPSDAEPEETPETEEPGAEEAAEEQLPEETEAPADTTGLVSEFDQTAREDDLDWGVPADIESNFGYGAAGEPEIAEPASEPEPEEAMTEAESPEAAEEILPEEPEAETAFAQAEPEEYEVPEAEEPEETEAYTEDEPYEEQYDENGQYADDGQYDEQYDENGQYADDGQYEEQYDENGQYADDRQYDEQYDENGQYAEDGQYDEQYDENGQYAEDGQYDEQYDENGQYAEDGQYDEQYDENGQDAEVGQYDEQYDENGQDAEDGQYDEQYDENGQDAEDGQYEEQYDDPYAEDDRMSAVQIDPTVALVDLCRIEAFYDPNEVVSLETLKERGIVLDSARTLKVHASGELNIPLTVEAQNFSLEALTAISNAGGESIRVKEG